MRTTLHDVARDAGVSIKTVSNVVNERRHVSAATRARVADAVERLGYRPNLTARTLRNGRSNVIGLAVPELTLAYFAQLADDVMREAEERGLVVMIEQTRGGDRDREIEMLRGPRRQFTDGLLFSPLGMSQDDARLVDIDTPIVLLGERIFGAGADHVTMQNTEAAEAATRHLIERGRRRIAVLGVHPWETLGSAALRYEGYRRALEAAGLPVDPDLVIDIEYWHRRNGAGALHDFLDRGVAFDGLFAMNDELALGALRAMQERGVRVPDDVAVIGFDNIEESQYSSPSLSSVEPGRAEIARIAVEVLLERIEGVATAPRELRSQYSIIARESSGA